MRQAHPLVTVKEVADQGRDVTLLLLLLLLRLLLALLLLRCLLRENSHLMLKLMLSSVIWAAVSVCSDEVRDILLEGVRHRRHGQQVLEMRERDGLDVLRKGKGEAHES